MADHEILYIGTLAETGYVVCTFCGWRSDSIIERHLAEELGDRHLRLAETGRLNSGARPSIRTLIRQYRANALNLSYNHNDRVRWAMLASELEAELQARDRNQQLEGQLEIPFG